jgi:hypothetical protein
MTKKRRYLIAAALLAASIFVVIVVLASLPARPGVTKANFDRIEDGMTMREVEQILGGVGLTFHGFADQKSMFVWAAEDGSMAFVAVSNDAVLSKSWHASRETILTKLRRWLRLS